MHVEMTDTEALKMLQFLEIKEIAMAIRIWSYKNPNQAIAFLKDIRNANS